MSERLIDVENLSVSVDGKQLLHGIDLHIKKGETHVPVSYTHLDVYKRQGHPRFKEELL